MPKLSWEFGLAVLGIALTIYFGGKATAVMRRKKQNQRQSVSHGSIGIQSGRDTKINE